MVPIKDATKGMLFHIAGLIVSHAVRQKGSVGFPILAPHLYSYIVDEPKDQIALHMKKEYIPLDASTALLHELLTGLESCQMICDLHALLEENEKSEGFWQVINSSRWPKEKAKDINPRFSSSTSSLS